MALDKLRKRIDELDGELVKLLNERARVVVEIGNLKNKTGGQVYSPDREKQVFEKLKNVKFLKGEEFKELIPKSRFFVLHNTTLAMEFLQYDIPIFRFDDKYFVDLWDYPDKFKNFQGLDKLFDKFCERKKKSGGKSFYRVEFLRHFHISKKGTSQNYYDKISSLTSQFYNNKV